MHTDKSFPPDSTSLGKVGGDSANQEAGKSDSQVTWLRASTMAAPSKIKLFGAKVNPRQVCQGTLGDCWLIAAMACVAEHDGAIHSIFQTKEYNPRGMYKLRLYNAAEKKWVKIVVDDYLPCDKGAYDQGGEVKPLYSQPQNNEIWVAILEKAFAKFCGGYAALEGGDTNWALRAMTGDPVRCFMKSTDKKALEGLPGDAKQGWVRLDLSEGQKDDKRACGMQQHGAMQNKKSEVVTDDALFELLKKYDEFGSVLSVGGCQNTSGLHGQHAYSILRVAVASKFRLVQIRNPWGKGEWTGDWSDKSAKWAEHPEVKKAVNFQDVDDGSFWMGWEDFCANWSDVGVVDRTVGIQSMRLQLRNHSMLEPCCACCRGCSWFWCLCMGIRRLYCTHQISDDTVTIKKPFCSCCSKPYRKA